MCVVTALVASVTAPAVTAAAPNEPSATTDATSTPSQEARPVRVEVETRVVDGVEIRSRREWYAAPDPAPAVEPNAAGPSQDDAAADDDGAATPRVTGSLKDGMRLEVPAGEHGFWLQPSVRYWLISQTRRNVTYGAQPEDGETKVRQQVRLGMRMGWGPLEVFGQVQDARDWGFEESTTSNDANVDLHQGYVRLNGASTKNSAKGEILLGRQEIWVGTRRLFAERPWNTVSQSFDALRMRGSIGSFRADLWAAMLARPRTFTIDDGISERAYRTRGSYVGMGVVGWDIRPEVSVEARTAWIAEDRSEEDVNQRRVIASPGLRIFGDPFPGLRYDVEGYVQTGQAPTADRRHFAWAAAGTLSYQLDQTTQPRFTVGYTIASGASCEGDSSAGDTCDDSNSATSDFFDFYRRRHGYQGIADQILWRNMRDLEVGTRLQLERRVRLDVDYHFFQLQEATGRWWKVPENLVGAGWDASNRERTLGHEMDVVARYRPWAPLGLQLGYALFVPTKAGITIAGGSKPQHFAYFRLEASF